MKKCMQKLRERGITNTPTNIPHVRSNCGPALNAEETLSVPGLKTFSNNVRGQWSEVPRLFLVNRNNKDMLIQKSPSRRRASYG